MEIFIQCFIIGVLGGFSISCILSLLGFGIYRAVNLLKS